jgi:hypothetical protein
MREAKVSATACSNFGAVSAFKCPANARTVVELMIEGVILKSGWFMMVDWIGGCGTAAWALNNPPIIFGKAIYFFGKKEPGPRLSPKPTPSLARMCR